MVKAKRRLQDFAMLDFVTLSLNPESVRPEANES